MLLTIVYKRTMLHSQVLTLLFYGLVRSTNKLYSIACDQRNILNTSKQEEALKGAQKLVRTFAEGNTVTMGSQDLPREPLKPDLAPLLD